jgi:hypothetical protein
LLISFSVMQVQLGPYAIELFSLRLYSICDIMYEKTADPVKPYFLSGLEVPDPETPIRLGEIARRRLTEDTYWDIGSRTSLRFHYERVRAIEEQLTAADDIELAIQKIPIGSGFRCVIETASDDSKYGYIPARIFAEHFSQWRIPIAPPGAPLHQHDLNHIPDYQILFGVPLLANTVQQAASKALTGPNPEAIDEQCGKFTGAIDLLSDMHNVLTKARENSEQSPRYAVEGADQHLAALVELAYGADPRAEQLDPAVNKEAASLAQTTYQMLRYSLGMPSFEATIEPEQPTQDTGGSFVLSESVVLFTQLAE